MDHVRAVSFVVLANVRNIESLGLVEIELNGRALPLTTKRVENLHIDLRSVESSAAGIHLVWRVRSFQGSPQPFDSVVPHLFRPDGFLWSRGEISLVVGEA